MSAFRLSRKANSSEPYRLSHTVRDLVTIEGQEVYIGNHRPTDHFAAAAKIFVPAEALYESRNRGNRGKAPRQRRRAEF